MKVLRKVLKKYDMYFTKIAEVFSTALISPQTAKVQDKYQSFSYLLQIFVPDSKLYTPSTPNNSNETHNFMCLGRTGRFGQH